MPNKLKMNQKGNMLPNSHSFDYRYSIITSPATNLNATPMFYTGPFRMNKLVSYTGSYGPQETYAVMKYGKNHEQDREQDKEHRKKNKYGNVVYGNLRYYPGNMIPNNSFVNSYYYPNLTVDAKGNYITSNRGTKSTKSTKSTK
jgi:hypothetical protein